MVFSEASLLTVAEYISTTMLHHVHLYQYVLGEQQVTDMTILRLDVQTPTTPLPLVMGTTEGEWQRRDKLRQLEVSYAKMKEELQAAGMKEGLVGTQAGAKEDCSEHTTLLEAKLEEAISDLAKAHVQRARDSVIRGIAMHEVDMRFHVDKAGLLLSELPHLPAKPPSDPPNHLLSELPHLPAKPPSDPPNH